jgi:type 2 lantibiotic biosynthesis protein LanM
MNTIDAAPIETARVPPRPSLLALANPLIRTATADLLDDLRAAVAQAPGIAVDVESIAMGLARELERTLLARMRPTLALEMQVAKLCGQLAGATPQERFASFVERLERAPHSGAILAEYPGLERQLTMATSQLRAFAVEIVRRFVADQSCIAQTLPDVSEAGLLVHVAIGHGDRHQDGRTVSMLHFRNGLRLVYKPRSLAVDVHFLDLLEWLAARGGAPDLRAPKAIDRGDYGWVEYVAQAPCTSAGEVTRFFERQGAYLALLFVLEANDCHRENVVASGEHPVVVDLETLFHPRAASRSRGVDALVDESVLRVGLLPSPTRDAPSIDGNALGDDGEWLRPTWEGEGTDELRRVLRRRPAPAAGNLPFLDDAPVRAADHADAFVRGFEAMCALLVREREPLLAPAGMISRFAHDRVRAVLRQTGAYALLLDEALHPDCLRRGDGQERSLGRLESALRESPEIARVIPHERDALRRGDVPYFTAEPARTDLFPADGAPIDAYFAVSALDRVAHRLRRLEEEASRQVWFVRTALASMARQRAGHPATSVSLDNAPNEQPPSTTALIDAARRIGEKLRRGALRDGCVTTWLDLQHQATRLVVAPTGSDLYSGSAGIALFFHALWRVAGSEDDRDFACALLAEALNGLSEEPGALRGAGAFTGASGLLYALAHVESSSGDTRLASHAGALLDRIEREIDEDTGFDVVGGAAGAIGALLAWARRRDGDRAMSLAARAGERLLSRATSVSGGIAWRARPGEELAGYAHGAAGIGAMLGALGSARADTRFARAADDALSFARTIARKERRTSWCHGVAGFGIAWGTTLRHGTGRRLLEDFHHACATARTVLSDANDSACHGALSRLELLLLCALRDGQPRAMEDVLARANDLTSEVTRRGVRCGNRYGVETPGLLTGLAGVGYGLLRIAAPTRVASVLALDPPCVTEVA